MSSTLERKKQRREDLKKKREAYAKLTSALLLALLEHLTKPCQPSVPAEEHTAQQQERFVDVVSALVADTQAAHPVQPGESTLDHPAHSAQLLFALDAPPGNPRQDALFS